MNLLEYEAKQLLSKYDIPVPKSILISSPSSRLPTLPVILKSQVPTGGRGKAGGIVLVRSEQEFHEAKQKLFTLTIKSFTPSCLLAEEKLDIKQEFYLSVLINRSSATLQLLAHTRGGVEVEDNDSSSFRTLTLPKDLKNAGEQLAEYYDLPDKSFILQDIVDSIYKCFTENDATLIEINPLIITKQGGLVAGDCKMELDDAAAFRHPEWNFETSVADANFVTIDPAGFVATIANGAGLAMSTVDAVSSAGLRPANFLDIGGGASAESVLVAFRRIMEFTNIKAIVINIFAGITRCDQVAEAIISARKHIPNLPPLFIRLSGTKYEKAVALLQKESIPTQPTLDTCLELAKEAIHE